MFKPAHGVLVILAAGCVKEVDFEHGWRGENTDLASGGGLACCSHGGGQGALGSPLVSGWKREVLSTGGPVPQERAGEPHTVEKDNRGPPPTTHKN